MNYKHSLDIVQQDRDGTKLHRWFMSLAKPVKIVDSNRNNAADENALEISP